MGSLLDVIKAKLEFSKGGKLTATGEVADQIVINASTGKLAEQIALHSTGVETPQEIMTKRTNKSFDQRQKNLDVVKNKQIQASKREDQEGREIAKQYKTKKVTTDSDNLPADMAQNPYEHVVPTLFQRGDMVDGKGPVDIGRDIDLERPDKDIDLQLRRRKSIKLKKFREEFGYDPGSSVPTPVQVPGAGPPGELPPEKKKLKKSVPEVNEAGMFGEPSVGPADSKPSAYTDTNASVPPVTMPKKKMKTVPQVSTVEETDLEENRGLWDNIHAKQERIKHGSGEHMRKPGSKGAPSQEDLKDSQTEEIRFNEHIVRVGNEYRLVSKSSGKNLGTYPTKAGAEKREKEVQYFKHQAEELENLEERGADSKGDFRPTEKGAGMTRKGVAHYRAKHPGSKLKTAVTGNAEPGSKAAKRRKSFCARMSGMEGPMKDDMGRPTRKAMSLKRWRCR